MAATAKFTALVLPRIEQYGGDVMQSSLSEEPEARLRDALQSPQHASADA